jgi:hypothetical protein
MKDLLSRIKDLVLERPQFFEGGMKNAEEAKQLIITSHIERLEKDIERLKGKKYTRRVGKNKEGDIVEYVVDTEESHNEAFQQEITYKEKELLELKK